MPDLFDDMEEEAEERDGVDEEEDVEDEDESAAPEEPQESMPATGIVPQGKQGVFADRDSVFDTAKTVDHRNPVVTRAEETANELLPMRRPVTTKAQLVAVFDAQGRPFVAYHQNGRALEKFRLPTPQEFEVLRARGQIVKGGLGEAAPSPSPSAAAGTGAPPGAPPGDAPGGKTWLYVGAAALGVGALAWWYMNRQKKSPRANEALDTSDDGADADEE